MNKMGWKIVKKERLNEFAEEVYRLSTENRRLQYKLQDAENEAKALRKSYDEAAATIERLGNHIAEMKEAFNRELKRKHAKKLR